MWRGESGDSGLGACTSHEDCTPAAEIVRASRLRRASLTLGVCVRAAADHRESADSHAGLTRKRLGNRGDRPIGLTASRRVESDGAGAARAALGERKDASPK